MSMNLEDLEKGIERKLSQLEQEETRLQDALKLVRQASVIAVDFEVTYSGDSEGLRAKESEEPQLQDSSQTGSSVSKPRNYLLHLLQTTESLIWPGSGL